MLLEFFRKRNSNTPSYLYSENTRNDEHQQNYNIYQNYHE